jgi:hypothetical protein
LNSGSKQLPWTRVILFGTSANGQGAVVIIGPGVVCSRVVTGYFGHDIHGRTIAVKRVSRRLGTGVGGGRAGSIARPRTASNADANNRSDIDSVCASGKQQQQLTRRRRARASALRRRRQIFRDGRALGLVATSFSRFRTNNRTNAFAVWRAAWLCVAWWIVKSVTRQGDGACVVSA